MNASAVEDSRSISSELTASNLFREMNTRVWAANINSSFEEAGFDKMAKQTATQSGLFRKASYKGIILEIEGSYEGFIRCGRVTAEIQVANCISHTLHFIFQTD